MSPEDQLDFARAIIDNPDASDHAVLEACLTIMDTADAETDVHARALNIATLIKGEMAALEGG